MSQHATLAGLAGAGLGIILGALAAGQAPPGKAMPAHASDMEFTAPPNEQAAVYLRDDRYQDVPITVSPRDTPQGKILCTEGDQIVGLADDIVRDNLALLAAKARLVNLDDPGLADMLSGGRRELLEAMRRLQVGPDDETVRRQLVAARFGPWVNQVVGLVARLEGKTALIPPDLADAVHRVQQTPGASGVGIIGNQYRWPNGIVPYRIIVQGLPVAEAIAEWNSKTDRIRLRPARQTDPVWLEFIASSGCSSYIGKSVARGRQPVMLAGGCAFDQIVHEIGHALGLFHEQSRLDRDKYLIIQPQNIQAGTESNFTQVRVGQASDLGPFDFASVMLYGPSAFSATGQPTMIARNPAIGTNWGINHRQNAGLRGLSNRDVKAIAQMYPSPAVQD